MLLTNGNGMLYSTPNATRLLHAYYTHHGSPGTDLDATLKLREVHGKVALFTCGSTGAAESLTASLELVLTTRATTRGLRGGVPLRLLAPSGQHQGITNDWLIKVSRL
jgi:hypothetical protein